MPAKRVKKKAKRTYTKTLRPVQRGHSMWLPLPMKLARQLRIRPNRKLHWTVVDGVLQLSAGLPVMVISVMDHPAEKFGAQSV